MATIHSESNRPTPIYEYVCLGDASNRNPRRDVFFFSQFRIHTHSEMGYGKRYKAIQGLRLIKYNMIRVNIDSKYDLCHGHIDFEIISKPQFSPRFVEGESYVYVVYNIYIYAGHARW